VKYRSKQWESEDFPQLLQTLKSLCPLHKQDKPICSYLQYRVLTPWVITLLHCALFCRLFNDAISSWVYIPPDDGPKVSSLHAMVIWVNWGVTLLNINHCARWSDQNVLYCACIVLFFVKIQLITLIKQHITLYFILYCLQYISANIDPSSVRQNTREHIYIYIYIYI
jgi:hypothetical protein